MKWPTVMLKQVADIITGSTPPMSDPSNYGGSLPFVTPGHLDGGEPITDTEIHISPTGSVHARQLPPGAVLVSCIGSLGKVGIAGATLTTNQQINALVFDEKYVLPRWGYHYCRTLKPTLINMAPATTLPIVNKSRFSELEFPLPPLAEQERIAAILDEADNLRRKRRESIAKLDKLMASVFLEMFGDPTANPMNWPMTRLADFVKFLTSGSRGWATHYCEEGSSFLRIQNVGSGRLFLDEIAHVKAPNTAEANRTRVRRGDVLVSITADLGRVGVVPDNLGDAYVNQHLAIVRVEGINPTYLAALLASQFGQRQFGRLNRQGVKAGLNFDDIRSLSILAPPSHLQDHYRAISDRAEIQRVALLDRSARSELLFTSLQRDAFSQA